MPFAGALDPSGGVLRPDRSRPGLGLAPKDANCARYRVARAGDGLNRATLNRACAEGFRGQVGPDDLPGWQPLDGPPAGEL